MKREEEESGFRPVALQQAGPVPVRMHRALGIDFFAKKFRRSNSSLVCCCCPHKKAKVNPEVFVVALLYEEPCCMLAFSTQCCLTSRRL